MSLNRVGLYLQEYLDHGATCPILFSAGGDVNLLIDTFSPL